MSTTPLYFVRSGYIIRDAGYLKVAGLSGFYGPSSAASNIWGTAGFGVHYLDFGAVGVRPSYGPGDRCTGLPLRA